MYSSSREIEFQTQCNEIINKIDELSSMISKNHFNPKNFHKYESLSVLRDYYVDLEKHCRKNLK